MLWSILTVFSYTLSSLGDKFISAKLKCKPSEFAFIVSAATTFWLAILIPFIGWKFEFNQNNSTILAILVACKLVEFYTMAILLKIVSVYELKAWLGLNIIASYVSDVFRGKEELNLIAIVCSAVLIIGIGLILYEEKEQENVGKMILFSLLYIAARFVYGFQMGRLTENCSTVSALLIVMIVVAIIQLPKANVLELRQKKGISLAILSRIANAAGLITEALAAMQSVFFYALIQPIQLTILFTISIVKKEPMGKMKLVGSILSIIAVCIITFVVI